MTIPTAQEDAIVPSYVPYRILSTEYFDGFAVDTTADTIPPRYDAEYGVPVRVIRSLRPDPRNGNILVLHLEWREAWKNYRIGGYGPVPPSLTEHNPVRYVWMTTKSYDEFGPALDRAVTIIARINAILPFLDPSCPVEQLVAAAISKDRLIQFAALSNPACPEEARIAFQLASADMLSNTSLSTWNVLTYLAQADNLIDSSVMDYLYG